MNQENSYISSLLESPLAGQVEATFERFLSSINDDKSVLEFMYSYIKFNRVFGGCVLSLARDIHVGNFAFVREHPISGCQDVNTNVASNVLYAAEDEFSNKETGERQTHRTAAQHFLGTLINYFKKTGTTIDTDTDECPFAMLIKDGYGMPMVENEEQLFRSLGFHLATEFAGATEFTSVDNWMKREHPEIVSYMRGVLDHEGTTGYWWLEEHTGVEVEHYKSAVRALEQAVECYQGDIPLNQVYALITAGHAQFYSAFSTYLGATAKKLGINLNNNKTATVHSHSSSCVTGGCLCDAIQYEITSDLSSASNCHCSMCRKSSGSAFESFAGFEKGAFRWIKGENKLSQYESSPGISRIHCDNCGSSLALAEEGEVILVTLGTINGDPGIKPSEHLYVHSGASWHDIVDSLPQFAELPPEEQVEAA